MPHPSNHSPSHQFLRHRGAAGPVDGTPDDTAANPMPDETSQVAKTGKSLDSQKRHLIHPLVADLVRKTFANARALSIADLGCGDGSSFLDLAHQLAGGQTADYPAMAIEWLGFHDNDEAILRVLERNIQQAGLPTGTVGIDIQALKTGHYDLALAQLVLHLILDMAELREFLSVAHRALKADGHLFVVNLHPRYLDYHTRYSQGKLVMTCTDDDWIGEYLFDSNASFGIPIVSRSMEKYQNILRDCGFATFAIQPIYTRAIAASKTRYLDMWNRRIPMFYLMDLVKM